jgi:low affinity Fe/Cu permease
MQVKLDELLRVTKGAHVALLDLEELDEETLDQLHGDYAELAKRARVLLKKGKPDTNVPQVRATLRSNE